MLGGGGRENGAGSGRGVLEGSGGFRELGGGKGVWTRGDLRGGAARKETPRITFFGAERWVRRGEIPKTARERIERGVQQDEGGNVSLPFRAGNGNGGKGLGGKKCRKLGKEKNCLCSSLARVVLGDPKRK